MNFQSFLKMNESHSRGKFIATMGQQLQPETSQIGTALMNYNSPGRLQLKRTSALNWNRNCRWEESPSPEACQCINLAQARAARTIEAAARRRALPKGRVEKGIEKANQTKGAAMATLSCILQEEQQHAWPTLRDEVAIYGPSLRF